MSLPATARSLRDIAATRGASFYTGELAARMERAASGALRARDLAAHCADWIEPIAQPYRDGVLDEISPNGQGASPRRLR